MKNLLIISTLALGAFFFGTKNAQAQNHTATTTVNITLADVISIDAGSIATNGTVDFNYVTANDYNSAQTKTVAKSLIVTSTKNFNVTLKADGANFMNGAFVIPVSVLTVRASAGGNMAGTENDVILSINDQVLIGNAPKGSARTLNLDYEIPAARSSSSDILGKPAGAYTQTVTYTATAI
jgi:hypothetical protein